MLVGGRPAARSAVRHRDDGGIEEVEFFGDDALLFGCRHVPAGDVRAGLVVCSSILSDFGANYQREVRLGRRLAATGVVVQRFHPRGVGQSDGEGADVTLASMIEDAERAVAQLRERFDVDVIALLGTRFGALSASAVAAGLDGAPLVLWEPTVDPRRFVRDGLRARSVHQLKRGGAREEPESELDRCGHVDLLGLPVGRELFATPGGNELAARLGVRPRPVLLVQFEPRDDLRDEYRTLAERWSAEGFSVTTRCCPCDEAWWFVPDRLAPMGEVLDTTVDWLLAQLS
jgi:pimeloyl-ACP methyl ester carboxylesterase